MERSAITDNCILIPNQNSVKLLSSSRSSLIISLYYLNLHYSTTLTKCSPPTCTSRPNLPRNVTFQVLLVSLPTSNSCIYSTPASLIGCFQLHLFLRPFYDLIYTDKILKKSPSVNKILPIKLEL